MPCIASKINYIARKFNSKPIFHANFIVHYNNIHNKPTFAQYHTYIIRILSATILSRPNRLIPRISQKITKTARLPITFSTSLPVYLKVLREISAGQRLFFLEKVKVKEGRNRARGSPSSGGCALTARTRFSSIRFFFFLLTNFSCLVRNCTAHHDYPNGRIRYFAHGKNFFYSRKHIKYNNEICSVAHARRSGCARVEPESSAIGRCSYIFRIG